MRLRNLALRLECLLALGAAAAVFRCAPARANRWALRALRAPAAARRGAPEVPARAVGRYLAWSARLLPRTTCLASALAGAAVLRRHGLPAELRLSNETGGPGREFTAHAWVESGGVVVVGRAGTGPAFSFPASPP
ncbi:MAG: lasso peptide biosynthesis B2 protein [Sorangiineae bacterium]|nr:lasso peptide biosynthesis B2 protein [Polyangiaceae bacterium]MEB2324013.1 lasso peptide biosynthesis B2 protein [Sorangiineae bacterium]